MRLHLLYLSVITLLAPSIARADVIYNLTLTSNDGYAGGSGSFTLNTPPPATGVVTYAPFYAPPTNGPGTPGDSLLAFNANLSVAGREVSMTLEDFQGNSFPDIQFTNGVASSFYAFGIIVGERNYYQFGVGVSSYGYLSSTQILGPPTVITDSGTVTITPAALAATPEPSSLALVGTGLLGVVAVVKRRVAFLSRT